MKIYKLNRIHKNIYKRYSYIDLITLEIKIRRSPLAGQPFNSC